MQIAMHSIVRRDVHDGDLHGAPARPTRASSSQARDWWYGHVYPIETERGQDDTEDLFTPGRFATRDHGKATLTLWAVLSHPTRLDLDAELNAA